MLIAALGVSILLSLFSFLWVNKAIILMIAPSWPVVSRLMPVVEYGNTHREILVWLWVGLVTILFACQVYFLITEKYNLKSIKIWLVIALIALVSGLAYPLFSKDVFNYLFAAKTVTIYHQNPYSVKPQAYLGKDLWVDFMGNIDNDYHYFGLVDWKYAYGPVSVWYALVPTILIGAKRFVWLLMGYKLLNWLVFVVSGWMIWKINKNDQKVLAYWFLSPLLLTELLTNAHNDLIMIFFQIGAIFIWQRNKIAGAAAFGLSVLTKFVSGILGAEFLVKGRLRENYFKLIGVGVLVYCALVPKYPWYYSWAYMALPFANLKKTTWIWLAVLEYVVLITYYSGFLWLNRWTNLPFLPVWSNGTVRMSLTLIIVLNETGLLGKLNPKILKVGVR